MSKTKITISDHARWQASRRGLDEAVVLEIARTPEQVIPVRPGREIRQSRRTLPPHGKEYVIRVVVDTGPHRVTVVTVYRSSKIEKYWRTP